MARDSVATGDRSAVPPVLRPHLAQRRLTARLLDALWDALDDDAFRALVAARVANPDDLGPTAGPTLARAEGWLTEVESLEAAALARRDGPFAGQERGARKVASLEARVHRLRAELAEGEAARRRLREELRAEREAASVLAARVADLERELMERTEERTRAVREWKAAEERAARRTAELRRVEARARDLATDRTGTSVPAPEVPAPEVPAPDAPAPAPAARYRPAPAPRRRAHRLQRGVLVGTREAFEQLLGLPDVLVLVDGYNVAMARWPRLDPAAQRESLIAVLGTTAVRTGATFEVVFDGETGGRPAVQAPLPVRVRFTSTGVEADDVILEIVEQIPPTRPVVVISGDRRVQAGAARRGANVIDAAHLPPPLGSAR